MIKIKFILYASIFSLLISCSSYEKYEKNMVFYNDPAIFHESMQKLTDVIVYDIFSPPVASRIYVYPTIAAYEILINQHPNFKSLTGKIKGLDKIPLPDPDLEYSFPLASIHAFLVVGKDLIFSEEKITDYQKELMSELKELGIPNDIYNRSIDYGDIVASHIREWYKKDNYDQTRSFPKYTIRRNNIESWKPTPPDYMEGIEPHWNKIRTLLIDSADQFTVDQPPSFSMKKDSHFYKDLYEVYQIGKNLTDEQKQIASFWDCNPYVSHHKGHAMFATKKITPGGHWIGITKIATQKADLSLMETIYTYTLVSVGLFDSFIVCWDEKWRSILVRPETLINQFIDKEWIPYLQTPPFPEYTSGHSVISRTSAKILTKVLGDNFEFLDTTEEKYGLKARNYKSFIEAADEAAISRIWGGIHYMPAITLGVKQGDKVGDFVLSQLNLIDQSISNK
ncbi:MAG: vanadium-dependent haloperoxidase [Cytophagales bacterium]